MPKLLEPTDRDSPADRDRIARVNRNRRIKERYEQLKREQGRQEAWRRLADEHGLSPTTVRDIVYRQQ